MKSKNICKFITNAATDKLEVRQFIYETNPDIIKNERVLPNHRAILIKTGTGKIIIDNFTLNFKPGDFILCFANETVRISPDDSCEYLYIDFSGTRSDTLFKRFYINKSNRIFSGFDGMIPLWHESLCRASDINLDLVSEGILLYTFSRLDTTQNTQSSLVGKILEITEENFTSPALSLATVAEELSYNSKYISHIFKKSMGISYSQHLRTLRIKYAVSLLEHGIDSVKNIAFLSGFSDPLYFSNVFKETVGVSPKEYKKRFIKQETE